MPQTSITRVSTAIKMTRSVLQVPAHLVSKVTINPGSSMVAIMRRAPGTIVIGVLLLTAARGDAHDEPSAAKTTSRPPATSLRETCPMVRASLPRHMQPFARWQRFGDRLDQLAAAGNTETRNALEPLQNAVDGLVAGPATGQETVDAEQSSSWSLTIWRTRVPQPVPTLCSLSDHGRPARFHSCTRTAFAFPL